MNRKFIKVIGMYILMYIIHFLVLPITNKLVINGDNESYFILTATFIIITGITIILISDKFSHFLIGFFIYILLTLLYTPPGIYNIGMAGVNLDGLTSSYDHNYRYFSILILAIYLMFFNLMEWISIKIGKYIIKIYNQKKQLKYKL